MKFKGSREKRENSRCTSLPTRTNKDGESKRDQRRDGTEALPRRGADGKALPSRPSGAALAPMSLPFCLFLRSLAPRGNVPVNVRRESAPEPINAC